ncbi:virulence RhuM family protein [Acidovorax sp. FJL06]|uniref:virulence RhuM family protein n=1 Tax=Acidovorax sp. FJL06 TaxID=2153365 RepID=UPI000F58AD8B|nr:virulence RhuM family protein [Acidovorax sp. FJL06]RQO81916.1 hydroxyacid dehydrogenase [Acidovorax sp. FJL06]
MTAPPSQPLEPSSPVVPLVPVGADGGEFLVFQSADAQTRVQVRLTDGALWLTQRQMAELYQKDVRTVNEHLKNVYADGELNPDATIRKFRIVAQEGARTVQRLVDHYNLDAVLHVGYRVRSPRGAQFRQWATETLKGYLVKGFVLDDDRFKRGADADYFEELLARIRDIRSSEKMFWRKVLDIYATSVDYDPRAEASQKFFATVQNKMHWAAHGHTAAELIALRADASKPHAGLMTWAAASVGGAPRKADMAVAKNYLSEEELQVLNRIVNAYLEFAELQALNRQPMTMAQWIGKLDDFLRLSGREILTHAGRTTSEAAQAKAEAALATYRQQHIAAPSRAEQDFEAALAKPVKTLQALRKAAPRPKAGKNNQGEA